MPRIIKWHFVSNMDETVNNLGTKLNFIWWRSVTQNKTYDLALFKLHV